jgi:FkbM family methyltransferase
MINQPPPTIFAASQKPRTWATEEMGIEWFQLGSHLFYCLGGDVGMHEHNIAAINVVPDGELRTVVDIGAHVGFTTIPAAARGARVIAYEPNPYTFSLLCLGIIENRLVDRINPVQVAVGETRGKLVAIRAKDLCGGQSGTIQPANSPIIGTSITNSINGVLSHSFETGIDFLKIDIEGGEHELLPIVTEESWSRVRYFHLETHDVTQEQHHGPGHSNCDWRGIMAANRFEQVTDAVWKRRM